MKSKSANLKRVIAIGIVSMIVVTAFTGVVGVCPGGDTTDDTDVRLTSTSEKEKLTYDVSGTWTATSITGSGTFNPLTKDVTNGSITITIEVTGDITATYTYVAELYPGLGKWHGTSAVVNGTITVDGDKRPAKLWLKGDFTSFDFSPLDLEWSCELGCPVGDTHGATTDGEIVADFGWSGTCSGSVVTVDPLSGTWSITGSGSGTWEGVASGCLASKIESIGVGTGTVSLTGSPMIASLSYEVNKPGAIILARYKTNPGNPPTEKTLDKYVQVDSNIVDPEIDWSEVELRVNYTDAEVSAAGINESSLKMYRWNGTNWTEVSDSGVNTVDNYVWANLTGFSVYSPLGKASAVFDTGPGTYPSISGTHIGTITPNQNITVRKIYTYPCTGTGGHTEYVRIYGNEVNVSKTWNGYTEDYHNITFDSPFVLEAGKTYSYEIRTGSYPQIIHATNKTVTGGIITCTSFVDANGKEYTDWIPAIRLE